MGYSDNHTAGQKIHDRAFNRLLRRLASAMPRQKCSVVTITVCCLISAGAVRAEAQYTLTVWSSGCPGCEAAKSMMRANGIPFKTVVNNNTTVPRLRSPDGSEVVGSDKIEEKLRKDGQLKQDKPEQVPSSGTAATHAIPMTTETPEPTEEEQKAAEDASNPLKSGIEEVKGKLVGGNQVFKTPNGTEFFKENGGIYTRSGDGWKLTSAEGSPLGPTGANPDVKVIGALRDAQGQAIPKYSINSGSGWTNGFVENGNFLSQTPEGYYSQGAAPQGFEVGANGRLSQIRSVPAQGLSVGQSNSVVQQMAERVALPRSIESSLIQRGWEVQPGSTIYPKNGKGTFVDTSGKKWVYGVNELGEVNVLPPAEETRIINEYQF